MSVSGNMFHQLWLGTNKNDELIFKFSMFDVAWEAGTGPRALNCIWNQHSARGPDLKPQPPRKAHGWEGFIFLLTPFKFHIFSSLNLTLQVSLTSCCFSTFQAREGKVPCYLYIFYYHKYTSIPTPHRCQHTAECHLKPHHTTQSGRGIANFSKYTRSAALLCLWPTIYLWSLKNTPPTLSWP